MFKIFKNFHKREKRQPSPAYEIYPYESVSEMINGLRGVIKDNYTAEEGYTESEPELHLIISEFTFRRASELLEETRMANHTGNFNLIHVNPEVKIRTYEQALLNLKNFPIKAIVYKDK